MMMQRTTIFLVLLGLFAALRSPGADAVRITILAVCALTTCRGWGADAPPSPAPPAPVRLAVLAEDVSPESRALADLLTVELAAVPNGETGERAKFVLANLEL